MAVLSLFVNLCFSSYLGKVVLCECGIYWVSSLIFLYFKILVGYTVLANISSV